MAKEGRGSARGILRSGPSGTSPTALSRPALNCRCTCFRRAILGADEILDDLRRAPKGPQLSSLDDTEVTYLANSNFSEQVGRQPLFPPGVADSAAVVGLYMLSKPCKPL